MTKLTLVLNRRNGDLWLDKDGFHVAVIWNVTGVIRDEDGHVIIQRRGETIAILFKVRKDIKEEW